MTTPDTAVDTARKTAKNKSTKGHREPTKLTVDGGAIAFVEESHALPLVSFVIALRSGAAHEPEGKGGVARLTARMLRRGADGLNAQAIEEAIDTLGAELATEVATSTMAIHGAVIRRNFEPFIDLVARLLSTPTFDADELGRLRRESLAELIEARDNDRALAQIAFRRALFAGHPYSRGSAGTLKSVPTVETEDVRAFFAKHYVKGNVVLGFSGDLSIDDAERASKKLLAALPDGAPLADPVQPPPAPAGRKLVFVDKPERTQTQILIGTLGTHADDEDHVPLSVANSIFGGTFTSRLMKEVRSKRGWSYGASARLSMDRQRQSFNMSTFPAATDAAACIALELDLLSKWTKDGITAKELSFTKRYLTRSYAFDVDTASKRLHQRLDIELLGLPEDYYSGYIAKVEAVTREQANEAITRRIDPANLVVIVVGTASEIKDAMEKAIPDLAATEVVPFDSRIARSSQRIARGKSISDVRCRAASRRLPRTSCRSGRRRIRGWRRSSARRRCW